MENFNLCPLNRAYNQFFGGKKGFFPQYGKGKATLPSAVPLANRPWGVGFF
jgi:hypothetical protein